MSSRPNCALPPLMLSLWMLSVFCACGRPPADNAATSDPQKLPFDRQPRPAGISPSRTLIPSATKLPEGTPIPVRLESTLSSASSHAGDTFNASVDEPIVIDGQTLVPRGTPATGRVLESKPSAALLEPGYLRIVLVSLNVEGARVMINTNSIFAKGGIREERSPAPSAARSGADQSGVNPSAVNPSATNQRDKDKDSDIVFGVDRHLSFRLAQTLDLQ